MKMIYFSVLALIFMIFSSCKKDDDNISESDRSEALLGQWKYTSITTDKAVDINGDGKVTLQNDGFIILRFMVGFPAQALATDNDMLNASRTKEEMKTFLSQLN